MLGGRAGAGIVNAAEPVLAVERLRKHFPVLRGLLRRAVAQVKAVDGVTFSIQPGETLCLVGESGCGKSTVGKLILRFVEPTAGSVVLGGVDITRLDQQAMRAHRRHVQMVFQDPYASLNPRLTAGTIVAEPLENFETIAAAEREARVAAVLERVGLRADAMHRYPFEFSGGQRQRLGIARALVVNPSLIIADEPVSALDVSVQAQVLNLLMDLQDEFKLTYLFISHDLGVVEHIGHRIAVMYLGAAPLFAGAHRCGADPGSARPAQPTRRRRRRAEPDESAARLPLPYALPFRLQPLPQRGTGAARSGAGPRRRLPPARGREYGKADAIMKGRYDR